MDFYEKNPLTLRKLLAKRQNPSTPIFKEQPSNSTNHPKNQVNLQKKAASRKKKEQTLPPKSSSFAQKTYSPKNNFSDSTVDDFYSNPNQDITAKIVSDLFTDPYETIQKKVKISTTEHVSKKSSFDEEKSESEHSTAYDTHSEGSPITDVRDFLASPTLSSHNSKDPNFLKLDEELPLEMGNTFQSLSSEEDVFLFAEVRNPEEKFGNNFLTCFDLLQSREKTRCEFGHRLRNAYGEQKPRECQKCADLLRKCKSFAIANGGVCINSKFEQSISFICGKGHEWSVHHRRYDAEWCADCVREEKEALKRKCEEERQRREKLEEEYQRKLFDEARRKAMENISSHGMPLEENVLAYFQKIDLEVEKLAKEETNKFMSQEGVSNNVTYQQALQVNKVLIMPDDVLEKYMLGLSVEVLKSEFRRMAKLLHPDKNKHPRAGNAFQKIYKVYEAVVGRFEAS